MNEIWNALSQEMKPRFHEISMYLTALSFCWLFVFHPEVREGFFIFFTGFGSGSPLFIALGLIETAGLFLCLAHVFLKREKSSYEKALMGWFVVGLSGVASFFVGAETLTSRSPVAIILGIWNIVVCVLLLIEMGMQKYDVSEENASFVEVFASTTILFGILFIADLDLHLSWAKTQSICIFYSTSIVYITTRIIYYFDIQVPDFMKK